MKKILFFIPFFIIFSCSGDGIEGSVGDLIKVTAEENDDNIDVDYKWVLEDQPDGSLINFSDLVTSKDGQEMSFKPDYPGEYYFKVLLSQYGDEVSNQTFHFTIIENQEKNTDKKEENNENWLNENLESESSNEEYDDEEYDDEEYDDEEYDDEEIENSKNRIFAQKQIPIKKKTKLSPSTISNKKRYTIQITSKRILKDAQKFTSTMIDKGYDAYIQKSIIDNNDIWYRVRIGSFDSYNLASIAAKEISNTLKMPTWVDYIRKEQ